jgi:DNA-binding SARP family transcriptional activator
MEIRFLVLGEVDVTVDGDALGLESVMLRGLLGTLLLHANQFVPPHQLGLALWDAPPASASSNLRTYAARLRRSFALHDERVAARLLARRGSGYRLNVGPGELDHQEFRDLTRTGRQELHKGAFAEAVDSLVRALSLWRGQSGDDVPPRGYLAEQLRALNESRMVATEDLVEARLALGEAAHLVTDLRTHIARNPLRERPYGQLMRALYRSGDQSHALSVYDRLREVLDVELGVEPGPEVQLIHRAVLRHDDVALTTARLGQLALAA